MLSEKPWKVDWMVLMGATLMLSWSLGMLLSLLAGQFFQPQSPSEPSFYQFALSTVSFHGVALVLTHQFLRHHEMGWRGFLGLDKPHFWRALALALGVAVLMVPAALALNFGCRWLLEQAQVEAIEQRTIKILRASMGWYRQIAFGFGAIVLAPLVEEILFRAILYPFLKQRMRPWGAVAITTLAFAAIHTNLVTFVPLAFIGLVLLVLYEATDTLLAPILAHAVFNGFNFIFMIVQMNKSA
jgi:membrane protease YdiL (CAAX protease family)